MKLIQFILIASCWNLEFPWKFNERRNFLGISYSFGLYLRSVKFSIKMIPGSLCVKVATFLADLLWKSRKTQAIVSYTCQYIFCLTLSVISASARLITGINNAPRVASRGSTCSHVLAFYSDNLARNFCKINFHQVSLKQFISRIY